MFGSRSLKFPHYLVRDPIFKAHIALFYAVIYKKIVEIYGEEIYLPYQQVLIIISLHSGVFLKFIWQSLLPKGAVDISGIY